MRRWWLLPVILALATATPSLGGFRINVMGDKGFAHGVSRVVLVTASCHEAMNCQEMEQQLAGELPRLKLPFVVIVGDPVRRALFDLGAEAYSSTLREQLAAELEAEALLEVEVPFAENRTITVRGSEARVKVRLVRPDGKILMVGEGAGRAINTLSYPESVARATIVKVLEEARQVEAGK